MLRRLAPLLATTLALAAPLNGQGTAATAETEAFTPMLYASFLFGGGWPVGAMNVILDPGFMAGVRGEYAVSPMTRVGAQLSFHSFDHEAPGVADNEGVINLSMIGKAVGEWGPYNPFALLGLGAYLSKDQVVGGRRWDGGIQFGGGFELEVSEHLSVQVGTAFHLVFRGGENDDYFWLDGYLGFDFKQP